ncbi:hypothetical protein ACS0PU_000620 [Formica fusca]
MSSVPSPEFSDSLDSTITFNQYADNDENYNNDKHHFDRQLFEENNDKCQIRRKCAEKICSTNNLKTVSIDPSPKLFGNNQSIHKIRDSLLDNLSSKEKKTNDGCRVLSQDCVRRTKSPDIRNTITPLRYIQSAKGTWTYNL